MSLMLAEIRRKKFILFTGFDKISKKIPIKVRFYALKLHNFNFITSQVSCNVPMLNASQ